jgi:serine/threonine protein phosphatase PrpC
MVDIDVNSPLMLHEQQMTAAQAFRFLHGQVAVYSRRCPEKESPNEDALAVVAFDDDSGALVVADGMGGHADGDVAARTAIEAVVIAVREARESGNLLRTGIITGFEQANRKVQQLGTGAGTTLAVVELGSGAARPYHAGDSAILICGSRGKVKLETTPHSPVGFGVEAGLLDAREAMEHEERHLVLNAIGSDAMRIEIGSAIKLSQRDTVLLASDGLTDNLMMHEVVETMRKGRLVKSLDQLTQCSGERMTDVSGPSKPDDLTVIAFRNC